jgi:hypothetical protein
MVKKQNLASATHAVCKYGQKCFCNIPISERFAGFFITLSIIILLTIIVIYLVYLNRHGIAAKLSPETYNDAYLNYMKKNNENNHGDNQGNNKNGSN